jgi:hypothetical protein
VKNKIEQKHIITPTVQGDSGRGTIQLLAFQASKGERTKSFLNSEPEQEDLNTSLQKYF